MSKRKYTASASFCTCRLVNAVCDLGVESHGYISSMMEQNQISVSGSEYDIVNFYMSNSAQYVLFAVILGTLG